MIYGRDALVLVDFDNVYYDLSSKASFDWIVHELNELINAVFHVDPAATAIRLRFYGGWIQEGILSRKGSLLQQALAGGPRFPFVGPSKQVVSGDVELAMNLLSIPDAIWFTFLKEHAGLPRLRATARVEECALDNPACPMKAIQVLSQAKQKQCAIAGCALTPAECLLSYEQKLVDAFMTCDIWFAGASSRYRSIHVFSGDIDHLPGVLQSAALSAETKHYYYTTLSARRLALYEATLKRYGVETQAWRQK